MNLMAFFWTIPSFTVSDFLCVFHTTRAYSSLGQRARHTTKNWMYMWLFKKNWNVLFITVYCLWTGSFYSDNCAGCILLLCILHRQQIHSSLIWLVLKEVKSKQKWPGGRFSCHVKLHSLHSASNAVKYMLHICSWVLLKWSLQGASLGECCICKLINCSSLKHGGQ